MEGILIEMESFAPIGVFFAGVTLLALAVTAILIGTTRKTVTNQLGKFRRLGFLKKGRRLVLNVDRLSRFVHTGRVEHRSS